MKKIAMIILLLFLGGCGPAFNQEILKINNDYIQAVNEWKAMAREAKKIASFEVAVIEALLGERVKLLPYESYLNLEKTKTIAGKKGALTEEELGFLAVWKVVVLTPIALELLDKHAPDILKALRLVL